MSADSGAVVSGTPSVSASVSEEMQRKVDRLAFCAVVYGGAPSGRRALDAERKLDTATDKLIAAISDLEARNAALRSELEASRKFVEWCMSDNSWMGADLDGGDVQDKAEELGLIVKVPASKEFRAEYDCDTMYVVAWSDAARIPETPVESEDDTNG